MKCESTLLNADSQTPVNRLSLQIVSHSIVSTILKYVTVSNDLKMSFGQPSSTFTGPTASASAPAELRAAAAAAEWNANEVDSRMVGLDSPTSTNNNHLNAQSPLLLSDVQDHIRQLNLQFPPVLTETELQHTDEDVWLRIKHLLGRPLEEVIAEACATWTEILVRAKGSREVLRPRAGETTALLRAHWSHHLARRILGLPHPRTEWSHQLHRRWASSSIWSMA
jgi:hypothetical protein